MKSISKRGSKWLIRSIRTGSIILIAILLILLVFVHVKWWPWLTQELPMARIEARNWNNIRLYCTISDNLYSIWAPHASTLLDVEKAFVENRTNEVDLERLSKLPGVLDAFYINLEDGSGTSSKGLIPTDTLSTALDVRGMKRKGGSSQMMRRLVGGVTRFKRIKMTPPLIPPYFAGGEGGVFHPHKAGGEDEFSVLVRYVGSYYPARATEVIGLVLDEDWFISQVEARLDSLARDNNNLLFFAPQPPDTQWSRHDDPYAAPGGNFKQTFGVLHGADTLWWYGDRQLDITGSSGSGRAIRGYVIPKPEFDMTIMVSSELPQMRQKSIAGIRVVKILFPLLEGLALLLIVTLITSVYLSHLQIKRNNIALAHLAHSIKSPVARLRLNTDTLLEGRVSSPDEEIGGIQAINDECARMERAIQNATLSLIAGKSILQLEICSLSDIVVNSTLAWKQVFDKAGLDIVIDHCGATLKGRFDPVLITILMDNLIDNALHYSRLNRSKLPASFNGVTVRIKRQPNRGVIIVDDTGKGIPISQREKIFHRFYRGKEPALTNVSGLGLGLALVREIAAAHGGSVYAEDNPQKGARLIVKLPVAE